MAAFVFAWALIALLHFLLADFEPGLFYALLYTTPLFFWTTRHIIAPTFYYVTESEDHLADILRSPVTWAVLIFIIFLMWLWCTQPKMPEYDSITGTTTPGIAHVAADEPFILDIILARPSLGIRPYPTMTITPRAAPVLLSRRSGRKSVPEITIPAAEKPIVKIVRDAGSGGKEQHLTVEIKPDAPVHPPASIDKLKCVSRDPPIAADSQAPTDEPVPAAGGTDSYLNDAEMDDAPHLPEPTPAAAAPSGDITVRLAPPVLPPPPSLPPPAAPSVDPTDTDMGGATDPPDDSSSRAFAPLKRRTRPIAPAPAAVPWHPMDITLPDTPKAPEQSTSRPIAPLRSRRELPTDPPPPPPAPAPPAAVPGHPRDTAGPSAPAPPVPPPAANPLHAENMDLQQCRKTLIAWFKTLSEGLSTFGNDTSTQQISTVLSELHQRLFHMHDYATAGGKEAWSTTRGGRITVDFVKNKMVDHMDRLDEAEFRELAKQNGVEGKLDQVFDEWEAFLRGHELCHANDKKLA